MQRVAPVALRKRVARDSESAGERAAEDADRGQRDRARREALRNILLAWVSTLPICVALGAALFGAEPFLILRVLGVR